MIERRRRERINDCLNQLKKLVLEATQKDVRKQTYMRRVYVFAISILYMPSCVTMK